MLHSHSILGTEWTRFHYKTHFPNYNNIKLKLNIYVIISLKYCVKKTNTGCICINLHPKNDATGLNRVTKSISYFSSLLLIRYDLNGILLLIIRYVNNFIKHKLKYCLIFFQKN